MANDDVCGRLHNSTCMSCRNVRLRRLLKFIFLLFIIIGILGCASNKYILPAVNGLSNVDRITEYQKETIYNCGKLFPEKTQISIGLISDTTVQYFGIIRENDTIKSINNHKSVFEIGSITKVLNSSILAKLILQGKVKPNDNITDIIELNIKGNHRITIEQLANHTAGLERNPPDIKSDDHNKPYPDNLYTDTELLNYFSKNLKLINEPGVKMSYSNIGAQLLGYILCKLENADFETLLQENIFNRFGMVYSTTNKNKIQNLLVTGLDKDGNICSKWPWKTYLYAGSGTFSNVEDLSKFAMAEFDTTNYDLQFAQKKTFHIEDSVFQNSTADVGLDWVILNRTSGEKWIWHNGATDGYYSHIIINVQKRKAVVMLSNISFVNTQRRTTQIMIESLLESL